MLSEKEAEKELKMTGGAFSQRSTNAANEGKQPVEEEFDMLKRRKLLFEDDRNLFAYKREADGERLTVIANFTGEDVQCGLPDEIKPGRGQILLSNYDRDSVEKKMTLRPYESFMYYEKTEK